MMKGVPAASRNIFEENRPLFRPLKSGVIDVDSVDIPAPPPVKKSFDDYMKDDEFLKTLPKGFREQLFQAYISSLSQEVRKNLGRKAGWHNF